MALNFFPNSGTVVNDALLDIGAWDPEGSSGPTTTQRTNALQALNYLITSWQAHGMQVWCQKTFDSGVIGTNDTLYTLGSGGQYTIQRPLSIQQAWLRNITTGDKILLNQISREEFNSKTNLSTSGRPTDFFYDPGYSVPGSNSGATQQGFLNVYPSPDATTASTYYLEFIYTRPLQDFSGLTDSLDFPQEWYNAIRWNLALSLCPGYEVPLGKMDRIKIMAKDTLDLALSFDRELTSVFISPANA